MRDHRGRRGGNNNNNNNDRFNDNRPYKRGNRPMGINKARNEYQEDEPRAAREKPCRTLFVRNVQYTIPESEIRNLFAEYGEIKDVFNLIENRGMIFVTFYDVRAAEEAKHAMQGTYLSDRKIDVHYSLPKEEEEKARCDRTKNQGTLLYTLKNTNNELDDHELQSYFSQFGEVKAIRVPNFKKTNTHVVSHLDRNQQRLVEFYDSRACVAAYDATIDAEYKGGKWDVAFFWDHPYKERTNSHQKRERNLDREEMRNKRRDQIKREPYDHYGNQGQRMDDRYHPAPMGAPPMHSHQLDPRLQYNPQPTMPAAMPTAPMASTLGPDNQRLEQAQKAQQILSMLAQQQQQPPTAPAMQATQPIPSLTSPFQ
ncbi:Protein MEI2-like 2, partial [Choanephora cucurbitarum]